MVELVIQVNSKCLEHANIVGSTLIEQVLAAELLVVEYWYLIQVNLVFDT